MMKPPLPQGSGPELPCLPGRVQKAERALGCGLVYSRAQRPPSCDDGTCEKRWGPPVWLEGGGGDSVVLQGFQKLQMEQQTYIFPPSRNKGEVRGQEGQGVG